MAATVRTMTQTNDAGLQVNPISADNTNGDAFTAIQNGKSQKFIFYNPTGGSITATLKVQNTTATRVSGIGTVTPADKALAIAASKFGVFEILASDVIEYLDANGRVNFTYSGAGLIVVGLAANP